MSRFPSLRYLVAAFVGVALASSPADAAMILLHNTGVNSAGVPLPLGSDDPHWTVVAENDVIITPFPAKVLSDQTGSYADSLVSWWIWAEADGRTGSRNIFTFRLTFDLTGLDPGSATITGKWGVDNIGEIFLNGSNTGIGSGTLSLPTALTSNFRQFHSFTLDNGFVAGINTLDIRVRDTGDPAALHVTDLSGTADAVSAVPAPTGAVLVLTGLAFWVPFRKSRPRASFPIG